MTLVLGSGLLKRIEAPEWYFSFSPEIGRVSEAELIEKVRPNVGEAYFKEIAHRWTAAREGINGKPKKAEEFKSLYSDDEVVFNGLKKAGIAGLTQTDTMGKLDEEKATAVAQFREKFNDRMQAYFHENGKNPTDEVKQKIVNSMLIDRVFVKETGLFGVDRFASDIEASGRELSPTDRRRAYVPLERIPKASADAIRRQIQSRGRKVTDDKLQRAWAATVSGDRALLEEILGE